MVIQQLLKSCPRYARIICWILVITGHHPPAQVVGFAIFKINCFASHCLDLTSVQHTPHQHILLFPQDLVDRSLGELKNRQSLETDEIRAQAALAAAALQADGVPNHAPPDPGPAESTAAAAAAAAAHISPGCSASGGPDVTRSSAPSRNDSRAPRTSAGVADTLSSKRSSIPKSSLPAGNLAGRSSSSLIPATSVSPTSTSSAFSASTTAAQQQQQRSGLESWQASGKVWLQQIEKDLPRTFPDHSLMRDHGSKTTSGRCALRRILAAYSLHNPGVGYCQGMNFIAGCLLLFMNEEDAFYCLCTIVGEILAGYYSVNMTATQVSIFFCSMQPDCRNSYADRGRC